MSYCESQSLHLCLVHRFPSLSIFLSPRRRFIEGEGGYRHLFAFDVEILHQKPFVGAGYF